MTKNTKETLPPVETPPETLEYWQNKCTQTEMELATANQNLAYYQDHAEDLELNLEIANERWVKSVNEQAATEVALRKLQKKVN